VNEGSGKIDLSQKPVNEKGQRMACFGESHDPNDTDCVGGYNPAFTGKDGSRKQNPCSYLAACRGRVALVRLRQHQANGHLISPEALLRARQDAATWPPEETGRIAQTPLARQPQPSYAMPTTSAPPVPPPIAYAPTPQYAHPAHHYQPHQVQPIYIQVPATRAEMPPSPTVNPYLSVLEVQKEGESVLRPLGREMVRAGLKAFGQTFANFWDQVTLGDKKK
jgi:hypothetical protein